MAMAVLRRVISRANPASRFAHLGRRVVRAFEPRDGSDSVHITDFDAQSFDDEVENDV